jgi:hypothetical protein
MNHLRGELQNLREAAVVADAALAAFTAATRLMAKSLGAMHVQGATHLSLTQFEAAAWRFVVCGVLNETIFARRCSRPSPSDRLTFTQLAEQMSVAVERKIAQQLGEPTTEQAA